MKLILDMVHDNPGEAPFETAFSNPAHLRHYGYNGQVLKHINCAAKFRTLDEDIVPQGSAEDRWIDALTEKIRLQNARAKAEGLLVLYHIDLFVLPIRLVEIYRDKLCDEQGRISLEKPFTMEVHRLLFAELMEQFPEVDGFIVRVGETYLYDTPYHTGNGPIRAAQYEEDAGASDKSREAEIARYITLLQFLRTEICQRHNRLLLFRTWDCYPDKFHANLDYYLAVTDNIEPHEKLIFSIKHTALDFWRRVRFNPCIAQGLHRQIIEVQCQREYEGKGAYPNYIMDGVIDGFPENMQPKGLRDVWDDPRICGVYGWSRGGGWYGPYLPRQADGTPGELWCDLHAYVLAQFAGKPKASEPQLFAQYAREILYMEKQDAAILRKLCVTAASAVLHGRYCEAYDVSLAEQIVPVNLWMRDDRLGGTQQLAPVFSYLREHGTVEQALEEKRLSVRLWMKGRELAASLSPNPVKSFVVQSTEYGYALYRLVAAGWEVLLCAEENGASPDEIREKLRTYAAARADYAALADVPGCATLYQERYFNLPGAPETAGMGAAVEAVRLIALD